MKKKDAYSASAEVGLLCSSGCPWCQNIDLLMVIDDGDEGRPRKRVWCPQCDIWGPEHTTEAGAIETWDMRV
jgi:hypothetical protein